MKPTFLIPLFFILSACGSDSDSRLTILGTWQSTCYLIDSLSGDSPEDSIVPHTANNSDEQAEPSDTVDRYGITSLIFEINGQFTEESITYTDETCSIQEDKTFAFTGPYELGDSVITNSGLEAIEIVIHDPDSNFSIFGIIRTEGNTLYLSIFSKDSRPNSLNLSIPFSKL
jgi:hypothetical protein